MTLFDEKVMAVFQSIPYLLQGVGVTLSVTFLALLMGGVLGLLLALGRVYGGAVLRGTAIFYSRIIRSLPVLVILFFLYFLGYDLLNLSVFASMVLALGIHTSAYQLEIFRGAVQSIARGQNEAALAMGMTEWQSIFYIVLPQALRRAIPYWSNEAAIVLKDSSLAYVLGLTELMRRGQYIVARTNQALITYILIGIIYFVLTAFFTRGLSRVEKKVKIPG